MTGRLTTSRLAIAPDWRKGPPPVASEDGAPEAGLRLGAFPSSTRGPLTATFALPEAGRVRLSVVDALGREVAVLADGPRPAGEVRLGVSLGDLPAGAYAVVLHTEAGLASRRVVVVR